MERALDVEEEIQNLGLLAPRIDLAKIEATIASESYHVFKDSCLTVCQLTLKNGFNTIGTSACVSPVNFNFELGEKIARRNAVAEIWALEGYLLKERLFEGSAD